MLMNQCLLVLVVLVSICSCSYSSQGCSSQGCSCQNGLNGRDGKDSHMDPPFQLQCTSTQIIIGVDGPLFTELNYTCSCPLGYIVIGMQCYSPGIQDINNGYIAIQEGGIYQGNTATCSIFVVEAPSGVTVPITETISITCQKVKGLYGQGLYGQGLYGG